MATKTKTASKDANKKMTFKEYTKKLNAAYDSGYKDGWSAHEKLPNVRGSQMRL